MTKAQINNYLISKTVDDMTEFLIKDFNFTMEKALDIIYNSKTLRKLENTDNDLYVQSPSYVYKLLTDEYGLEVDF